MSYCTEKFWPLLLLHGAEELPHLIDFDEFCTLANIEWRSA
jgi:hypothetical protein